MRGFDLSESGVKKIVRAFNSYGVDGLIAKKRSGRKRIISGEQKEELIEEFEDPGRAQRTFWTATAFHGHIQGKYRIACSYDTVVRLLHEKGYVLKVPQPWPDRQDEALREEFRSRLALCAEDPEVELWYGDETGIDGEPKPRRGWAQKGSKSRVAHNGEHIRLNILGAVCPRTGEFFAIEAKPLRYGCLPGLSQRGRHIDHSHKETEPPHSRQRVLAQAEEPQLALLRTALSSSLFPRLQSHRENMAHHEGRALCQHPLQKQGRTD